MGKSTHSYEDDPRNASILISINGELFPRDEAKVSVFDSGFVLGDGVWEGLRCYGDGIAFLDQHGSHLGNDFGPQLHLVTVGQRA